MGIYKWNNKAIIMRTGHRIELIDQACLVEVACLKFENYMVAGGQTTREILK